MLCCWRPRAKESSPDEVRIQAVSLQTEVKSETQNGNKKSEEANVEKVDTIEEDEFAAVGSPKTNTASSRGYSYGKFDNDTHERIKSIRMIATQRNVAFKPKMVENSEQKYATEEPVLEEKPKESIKDRMRRVAAGAGGGVYSTGIATAGLSKDIVVQSMRIKNLDLNKLAKEEKIDLNKKQLEQKIMPRLKPPPKPTGKISVKKTEKTKIEDDSSAIVVEVDVVEEKVNDEPLPTPTENEEKNDMQEVKIIEEKKKSNKKKSSILSRKKIIVPEDPQIIESEEPVIEEPKKKSSYNSKEKAILPETKSSKSIVKTKEVPESVTTQAEEEKVSENQAEKEPFESGVENSVSAGDVAVQKTEAKNESYEEENALEKVIVKETEIEEKNEQDPITENEGKKDVSMEEAQSNTILTSAKLEQINQKEVALTENKSDKQEEVLPALADLSAEKAKENVVKSENQITDNALGEITAAEETIVQDQSTKSEGTDLIEKQGLEGSLGIEDVPPPIPPTTTLSQENIENEV